LVAALVGEVEGEVEVETWDNISLGE
jgi:hypothetical protein